MNELAHETLTRSISWVDRFAIGVSMLCLAHCLLMPVLLVVLPSLSASLMADENVHLTLVYVVIPSSLLALSLGCKQHHRRSFILIGLCGLGFLVLGACVNAIGLVPFFEQLFTVVGALLIAFTHVRNFQLCHRSTDSSCHENRS